MHGTRRILIFLSRYFEWCTRFWAPFYSFCSSTISKNHVLYSNVSFFADDTRMSRQINSDMDAQFQQKDLNDLIRWSQSDNMNLHENIIELLVNKHNHQHTFMKDYISYTTSSGKSYPVEQLTEPCLLRSLPVFAHGQSSH